ncbi:MAG: hypothetical protein QNI89_06475 [Desulfobacterales bacterium]|nr:hypothetical protein [Desulfobacterales bacterium]MDJ0853998.1 hypothetical protein [Desulfobacterales bacterium]MDJ0886924.1 hypothetical protein [Desulfobacterales bacterium]MDJ0991491.1 hypothetical protein [Desulfobacterales bacterium]
MNAVLKTLMAVCLFLGSWMCIFGYQSEKLIKISTFWSAVLGLAFAATFVYFAFIDVKKQ